jgi:hypothetical protein
MFDALLGLTTVLGGIAFDPHIRGVLIVLAGVLILCGSIYLILLTNIGHRVGFLVAFAGLMGWITILGLTWWLTPPAIGPSGQTPSWQVLDIVRGDPAGADEEVAHDLPNTCWSTVSLSCTPPDGSETVAAGLLAQNPEWVEEAGGENATLSQILNVEPQAADDIDFGEWHLVSAAEAGEAVSAADEELRAEEIFATASGYLVLDAWEQGGKPSRDSDAMIDRIANKIETTLQLRHPPHYAAIQIIPVIPQETEPGQAPPTPEPDPEQPVITVVMVRDLGNLRVPAALVTLGSATLLGVTCYVLHRRDKLATELRAQG